MTIRESIYALAMRGLRRLAPLTSGGESKLARGVRGRRDAADALVRWGREEREATRPLTWFHAPSVGEGFQARAVAQELRALRPDVQVVYTYFSPSAEAFARDFPADFAGFLPWDVPGEVRKALEGTRPDVLAFTKTEVWPVLAAEARRRGLPLFLVGAALPAGAGRLRFPARWLLRPAFRRLRTVATISPEDGARFPALGVEADRVVVTGDPGIDSAARRAGAADPEAPHLAPFREAEGRPTLVAGSTWPPDEERLVPAASRARAVESELLLVVAPHEPTTDHVTPLMDALAAAGWRAELLGAVEERGSAAGVDAVVVDRVGVLADLYTVGTMAYVGGGFHDEGLHSVLEPAAAGLPVLFGPGRGNARAAADLLEAGGAAEVAGEEELTRALKGWLKDPGEVRRAGVRAREYVDRHRGAARRTAELLAEALGKGLG